MQRMHGLVLPVHLLSVIPRDSLTINCQPACSTSAGLAGTIPRAAMTPQQQCLLDLLLAYEHMVRQVEVQGAAEARHAELRVDMRIPAG